MARFTVETPPHPDCQGLIDWHVYENGDRISVDDLVFRANTLARKVHENMERIRILEEAIQDAIDKLPYI